MKKKDDSETREQNQDHRWSSQEKQDNSETWKPVKTSGWNLPNWISELL